MNIYEIAEKAGVSIATVSRVLNNKGNISKKTYDKVMQVLKEYNYSPNAIARGLALNSMNLIGIVVDDIRNLYRANAVYFLEDLFSKANFNTLIFNAGTKKGSLFSLILNQRLDALVFVGSSFSNDKIAEFLSTHYDSMPILMLNGGLPLPNVYSVICDESKGMETIVDHLYRENRKNPIYVTYSHSYPASQRKYTGFLKKVQELGMNYNESRLFTSGIEFDDGVRVGTQIINSGVKFDSVICGLDLIAMGVMYVLKQYGYQIPEDVAITGFDNHIYGKLSAPFLTSVDSNLDEMASLAVSVVLDCLNGKQPEQKEFYVAPSLFLGGTT